MCEDIEDNLVVHRGTSRHGGALAQRAVLWRDGRHRHQPTCGILYLTIRRIGLQIVHQEVGSPLHHIVVLSQEILVARIEVVLPDVCCQPGTACWEHTPRGAVDRTRHTEEVGIVMGHPTLAAIHLLRRRGTRLTQVADHREERLLRLSDIAHEGRPVIHLGIDIDGVLRIPWCIHLCIPDTLQIGRLSTGLRT